MFYCGRSWVVVVIVKTLARNYLLLVVEEAGTFTKLCEKGQDPIIGDRNPHVSQLVNELRTHVCM